MSQIIMRAKKSLGQHFLKNAAIADAIVDGLTGHGDYKDVLEVGPGHGILTEALLNTDFKLWAVETDYKLGEALAQKFPGLSERIFIEDFLKFHIQEYLNGQFALIGNYPYNISSQILFRMLEMRDQIPEMVGMFQKEVGMRVISPHGSKVYGILSVLVQAYYNGESLMKLGPGSFSPPPKVDSIVIRLQRRDTLPTCSFKRLRTVVKAAFGQRRKMLRNSLSGLFDAETLTEDLFMRRPEAMSVQDFIDLSSR